VYELTVAPDLRELESQLLVPLAPLAARASTDDSFTRQSTHEERVETRERPEPREAERAKPGKRLKKARGKPRPPAAPAGPVQDEWGIFDPNRCGFAALVDKLDEVSEEKPEPDPRTKVRLISYR
jgi:hypothetical protein